MSANDLIAHLEIDRFDAVEVHPIRQNDQCAQSIELTEWAKDSQYIYYWSVFLHYKNSHSKNHGNAGLEWIADVATEQQARSIAAAVEQLLI